MLILQKTLNYADYNINTPNLFFLVTQGTSVCCFAVGVNPGGSRVTTILALQVSRGFLSNKADDIGIQTLDLSRKEPAPNHYAATTGTHCDTNIPLFFLYYKKPKIYINVTNILGWNCNKRYIYITYKFGICIIVDKFRVFGDCEYMCHSGYNLSFFFFLGGICPKKIVPVQVRSVRHKKNGKMLINLYIGLAHFRGIYI